MKHLSTSCVFLSSHSSEPFVGWFAADFAPPELSKVHWSIRSEGLLFRLLIFWSSEGSCTGSGRWIGCSLGEMTGERAVAIWDGSEETFIGSVWRRNPDSSSTTRGLSPSTEGSSSTVMDSGLD